jgi:hypothetical protein
LQSKYNEDLDLDVSNNGRDTRTAEQKLQRDDWMMMPPTQDSLLARIDPTKLRPGKFRSGKAAGGPAGGGIESTWTETPEQKRKRLENEMLGIAAPANSSVNNAQSVRKEDEEAARRIKEYNVCFSTYTRDLFRANDSHRRNIVESHSMRSTRRQSRRRKRTTRASVLLTVRRM